MKKGSDLEVVAVLFEDGKREKFTRGDLKSISLKTEKNQKKILKEHPVPVFKGIGQNTKAITITNEKTGKSLSFNSISEAAKHFSKEGLLADSLGDRLKNKSKKPYKGYIVS